MKFLVLPSFGTLSFQDPWFGFEQEYYLIDPKTKWPLGWPKGKYPDKDTDAWQNARRTWHRLGQGSVEHANSPETSDFMPFLNIYNIYVTYIYNFLGRLVLVLNFS